MTSQKTAAKETRSRGKCIINHESYCIFQLSSSPLQEEKIGHKIEMLQ